MPLVVSHFAQTPGRAGQSALRQHDVRCLEPERTFVIASAFSLPRLWGYLLDASVEGFANGLGRPTDGSTSTRMHHGLDAARRALRARVEALLEKRPPDVGLLALTLDDTRLSVLSCGPGRVYVRHNQRMRRLSPREDRAEGLLKATPAWCVEPIEPGDLIIAGSLSACADTALTSLAAELERHDDPQVEPIVQHLLAGPESRGIGAAALAIRVEQRMTVI